jgi:hypothetical protein
MFHMVDCIGDKVRAVDPSEITFAGLQVIFPVYNGHEVKLHGVR